jgi:hypothetical protein
MRQQVTTLYKSFDADPSILLPQHHYLFTTKTLTQCLQQNYDGTQCWLRSVAEAMLMLDHHIAQQQEYSDIFFGEEDSSYSPSTHSMDTSTTLTLTSLSSTSLDFDTCSIVSVVPHDHSIMSTSSTSSNSLSSPPSIISWTSNCSS